MRILRLWQTLILCSSLTVLIGAIGCGASSTKTAPPAKAPAPAKTVSAVAITPASENLTAGATEQFTATATYSDGSTTDVTKTATWASATPAVATINTTGLASAVSAGSTAVTASFSSATGTATLTVAAAPVTLQSIAVTPMTPSILAGATQQFTATATYSDSTTADITGKAIWASANTAVATVSASGLATAVAAGSTSITAALSGVTGNTTLAVTAPVPPPPPVQVTGVNVPTWHADAQRTGLNAAETVLTPANVAPQSFGKLFSYLLDGYSYGEPLIMSGVTIGGAQHNVLYVATERDSVYALDADSNSAPLWKVSLLQPGETPLTTGPIQPYEGVTSTPVIDPATNTMYVVSAQTSSTGNSTFRLNALDITTGAQKPGSPITIQASVPGTNSQAVNGTVSLSNSCIQRAALLLNGGSLYIGFGSCKSGWLLAYNAQTLAQTGVFNSSPNLNGEGAYASAGGIWMGGGGPAADTTGDVYVTTGNGPWDGLTAWSDSVLKFSPTLQLLDYFTPADYLYMNCKDSDLGAGGLLLIPGTTQALVGGKIGKMYLVNTANLGHEQVNDAGATQNLFFESDLTSPFTSTCTDSAGLHTAVHGAYEIFGTAAYFDNSAYLGVTPTDAVPAAAVRRFTYNGTLTPADFTVPGVQENSLGTTPFISANANTDGIMWMIDPGLPLQNAGGTPSAATLRAYDASDLTHELYNSTMNPADTPGYGIKFSSPVVANGKAFISTGHDLSTTTDPQGEIDVYGLK